MADAGASGRGRVGRWYWALVMGGACSALLMAYVGKLGVISTLNVTLPTLPSLYLAWKAFQLEGFDAVRASDMESAARDLADLVRHQRKAETGTRGRDGFAPMPVTWAAADFDFVHDWSNLRSIAAEWPGARPENSAGWPSTAAGLSGRDEEIGEVFSDRTPARRLLLLGEPGAGKTTLLNRLLLHLLDNWDAAPEKRVPVLFNLGSWHPEDTTLMDLMVRQLRLSYPGLTALPPAGPATHGAADLAEALLQGQRILPILDGFDELPVGLRARVLAAVNDEPWITAPLVLSSRLAEFREAVHAADVAIGVYGAAGITILPMDAADAARYLRGRPGTEEARRWAPVVAQLGTQSPVGQALSTPLGLFLARRFYRSSLEPGYPGRTLPPDPAGLCQDGRFRTRDEVDEHLLGSFLPSVYGTDAPQAHRVLTRIARHLEDDQGGAPDIAWWRLRSLLPARRAARFVALVLGGAVLVTATLTASATASLTYGAQGDILYCLSLGLYFGLLTALTVAGARPALVAIACALVTLVAPSDGPVLWRCGDLAGIAIVVFLGFSTFRRTAARFRSLGAARILALGLTGALIGAMTQGVLTYVVVTIQPVDWANPLTFTGEALESGARLGLFLGLSYAARVSLREAAATPGGRLAWAWSRSGCLAALLLSLVLTGIAACVSAAMPSQWGADASTWTVIAEIGLSIALVTGLAGGIGFGLSVQTPDLATVVGPETVLRQDREATGTMTLMTGGVFLVVFGLSVAPLTLTGGSGIFGVATFACLYALLGAMLGALRQTSYILFVLTQSHLARYEGFPPDLMAFLDDARSRGILRQVGPVHQFRHIDLQRHLARQSRR
ncbi:NACHT domain-containing protein [Streptomyces sp. R35]|uniref:NACHT domain-containing protein n=1 Tax=Streptomyces sp. R35 TaxID=3238630 RepID=A0AB39S5X9_9ACTN